MKQKLKALGTVLFLLLIVFTCFESSKVVFATAEKKIEETGTLKDSQKLINSTVRERGEDFKEEPSVFMKAIMSRDSTVYEREKRQYYISTFTNAAEVPIADDFDVSLIIPMLMTFVLYMMLVVVLFFTYILLLFYNFIFGGIFQSIVQTVVDIVNNWIFNWSDGFGGIGWRLLFIITLAAIALTAVRSSKEGLHPFSIIREMGKLLMLMVIIGYSAQYMTAIIKPIDQKVTELSNSIVQTTLDGGTTDVPMEITHKSMMYELLEIQPFTMRTFGVVTPESIPDKTFKHTAGGAKLKSSDEFQTGITRFRNVWFGHVYWEPGKDWTGAGANIRIASLQVESCQTGAGDRFCSDDKDVGIPGAITRKHLEKITMLFFTTLIMIPSTLALQVALFILLCFMLVIKGIVYLRPVMVLPEMVKVFKKTGRSAIFDYFVKTGTWLGISSVCGALFVATMTMIMKLEIFVGGYSPLAKIGLDFIICVALIIAVKNGKKILAVMNDLALNLGVVAKTGILDYNARPGEAMKNFGKNMQKSVKDNFGKGQTADANLNNGDEPIEVTDTDNQSVSNDNFAEYEAASLRRLQRQNYEKSLGYVKDDQGNSVSPEAAEAALNQVRKRQERYDNQPPLSIGRDEPRPETPRWLQEYEKNKKLDLTELDENVESDEILPEGDVPLQRIKQSKTVQIDENSVGSNNEEIEGDEIPSEDEDDIQLQPIKRPVLVQTDESEVESNDEETEKQLDESESQDSEEDESQNA